jgi:hypothetical protein
MVPESTVSLALVHHANQYIITNGYENREGIDELVGTLESRNGYLRVLQLHKAFRIPLNLHLSGTLMEALLWHCPSFLEAVQELAQQELLELVGSSYGQNIMRFFSYEHNLKQLSEELQLYREHLNLDPCNVKVFWPPERVWDTEKLAPVLTDPRLPNGGYQYVLIDDRLLYPIGQGSLSREAYDRISERQLAAFRLYRILHGQGLIALPIANGLRQNIPARDIQCSQLKDFLQGLSAAAPRDEEDLIAIYGDDLEKAGGVGPWDAGGSSQYEALLKWVTQNSWVRPIKLSEWASAHPAVGVKRIDVGTFLELTNHFGAGEGYERWYFDPRWDPYRSYHLWSEGRVKTLSAMGADPTLIELAWKQLLASSWETAWHIPPSGPHGNPDTPGAPSPWTKALASHSRHAAVIAEAAYWMRHKDDEAHAYAYDIDNDGVEELILKNDKLFAVVSPRRGGRLVYLFSVDGRGGKMVIGNPCDDWNWLEELNAYMDAPRNHPGALADVGLEHDSYQATVLVANGQRVEAGLQNDQVRSPGCGLVKDIVLSHGSNALEVHYNLPEGLPRLDIEFGLSPDYLTLLRHGCRVLRDYEDTGARGCCSGEVTVWVKPKAGDHLMWTKPYQEEFGHGRALRLAASKRTFSVRIGVDIDHHLTS